MRKKKLNLFRISLTAVFLAGLLVRVIGTNPGFPQTHPDEPVIYSTAISMIMQNTWNPFSIPLYKFYYPGLIIYLYAFLFKVFFIPFSSPGLGFVNAMFWSRYLTAFLSSLSIPLVYLIGEKMFDKKVGLIAAFFLVFDYRNVLSSHFGLLDSINGVFALLVLYFCLKTLNEPTQKNYVYSGIAIGLSMATKLYFFSILPFALVHILTCTRKGNFIEFLKRFFSRNLLLAIFSFALVFLVFNPFLPFNLTTAKHTLDYYNLRIGLLSPPLEITFPSIWYLYEIGFGKIMSLLFIYGLILFIKNRKLWVNGVFFIFFIILPCIFLLYLSHGGAYVRYFASITPFAVIISAYAFCTLTGRVEKHFKLNTKQFILVMVFFALVTSFDQIRNLVILDYFAVKPWNSVCIKNWVDSHIQNSDKVAANSLVPLSKNKTAGYLTFDNTGDYKNSFSLSELQNDHIDYVVANIEYLRINFNWWLASSGLYFGIPTKTLDNFFDSIALKELSKYTVTSCVKPWQSPDNNFVVFKIPSRKDTADARLIKSVDFKNVKPAKLNFQDLYKSDKNEVRVVSSSECRSEYCLKVEGLSGTPSRDKIIIATVPVTPNKRYIVKALVKSQSEISDKKRDGFIRLDFYNDSKNVSKRGITATISPRYFGDGSWKEAEASAVSPKDANTMQISFQAERYDNTFLIDSVRVYQGEDPGSYEINQANKKEIEDEVLYPLSIL